MSTRGNFGTRLGFIMAASGSAVGLGNIWKFPYITGEYGGGAFVLMYLVCIALVGLPLMYAELVIGRRGGTDVVGALRKLTAGEGRKGAFAADLSSFTGGMAVAAGFLILSFYSVVAGWAIHFFFVSLDLISMDKGAGEAFGAVAGSPLLSSVWHTIFMVMTVLVVAKGIQSGIEKTTKRLMPTLIGILLLMLVFVAFRGGLGDSLAFLFKPDIKGLQLIHPETQEILFNWNAVLEALGHAFFTLSLGMGAMVTYGSYLDSDSHIVRDGVIVAILDTAVALLAGTVIFAVVFAAGAEPNAGPGLVFVTLPDLFAQIPHVGMIIGAAFFLLLVFAAWSSAISLMEVVVAWLVDQHGYDRSKVTWAVGGLIWGVGLAVAKWMVILDFLDNLTTRYMLPIGGLAIAIAAGWLLSKQDREAGFDALGSGAGWLASLWTVTIRFVTPALVALVILAKMGVVELTDESKTMPLKKWEAEQAAAAGAIPPAPPPVSSASADTVEPAPEVNSEDAVPADQVSAGTEAEGAQQ